MISSFISSTPFDFTTSLLGRTLSTLQGLMQHKYQQSWPYTIPVMGRLFLHLKEASYPVLASTLKASIRLYTHGNKSPFLNITSSIFFLSHTQELSQLETKLLDAPSSAAPPGSQAAIHVSEHVL